MQIKSLIVCFLAAFSGVAAKDSSAEDYLSSAGVTGVPDGKTATSLAHALQSAYSSMATRKDLSSAWSVVETAVPSKVWESITEHQYVQYIETTAPPSWFTGLPKKVKSELVSQQSVVNHVITSVLKIKASTAAAAQPTAQVMAGGAALAGALGVIALL